MVTGGAGYIGSHVVMARGASLQGKGTDLKT